MDKQQQPKKQEIKIADNIPGAEYSNLMNVGFSKEEFVMTFMNVMGNSGRVVSKVMTSPGHMKRIVSVLQQKIKDYEQKNGSVDEAQAPTGLGFEEREQRKV